MRINQENWNYSFFKQNQHKAFISFCAQPIENTEEISVQYAITVTDSDDNEIFQQNYHELKDAVEQINERYQNWDFFNLAERSDGDGCGTCSAH
jgi:hypothetical protein